ncbi:MAG TPA: NAD(P)-dependent oxidoreductase [Longimicrobiales bacterium]|nr:NAD(P)-dependent oxidoreductase [Longimicrobiales bacterium]
MADPVVLVTGGSGMLGRALAQRLHQAYTVVGLDVVEPPADVPFDAVHYMDLTSPMSTRYTLRAIREEHGAQLAAVVHLAAYHDLSGDESPLYDQITVGGTRRLLKMLEDFDVDRFVFSSTMLVHAPVKPGEKVREDSPLDARWAYPRSKLETERLIEAHEPHIPYTLLRIAGVYTGFGKQPALSHQIERIYEQEFKSFFFPGDSEAGQSMVHIDDAVEALALTVERREQLRDGPILIGEPVPLGYAELQDRIGTLIWGEEWPTIRVPGAFAKAAAWLEEQASDEAFIKPYMISLADDHYALDISRAQRWLGWEPERRLEDELPGIIDTLRSYPVAWQHANGLLEPELGESKAPGS